MTGRLTGDDSYDAPALRLWRSELRRGLRTRTDFDWLWRAACLEIEAEEFEHDKLLTLASERRRLAAALVLVAAEREQGRAA